MSTVRTGLCALLLFLHLPVHGQWAPTAFLKEYFVTDLQNSGDTIVAVLGRAVFLSEDGGASARFLGEGTGLPPSLRANIIDSTLYALGDEAGLSRSSDWGASWQTGTFTPPVDYNFRRVIPDGDGNVLAISYKSLYRSSDEGLSWEEIPLGIEQEIFPSFHSGVVIGDTILLGSDGMVLRSDDDGATWSWIEIPGLENQVTTLRSDLTDVLYAGSSGSGVYRSLNGGLDWESFYAGVPAELGNVLDLEIARGTELYLTTNISTPLPQNLYKYDEESSRWLPLCAGESLTTVFVELTSDDEFLYASTEDEGILKRPLAQLTGEACSLTSARFADVPRPLRMYPNPATEWMVVDHDFYGEQLSYSITDILGRKVLEQNWQAAEQRNEIDLRSLPPGTYAISLRAISGPVYSGRLVIR